MKNVKRQKERFGPDLERLQSILITLEHLTKRRLLLPLGQGIHGLIHLDGGRGWSRLDTAYQMSTETDPALKKLA